MEMKAKLKRVQELEELRIKIIREVFYNLEHRHSMSRQ
jgi:hypothetical protein